jgi:protein-S-isoprenylcysteine O-methyltransferase
MSAALMEHALEAAFIPLNPPLVAVAVAGAALSAAGQALRWAAILAAGPSFSHSVALAGSPGRPGHRLVVTGPYALARHPAYLGWAAWAVGLCGLLTTPACAVLFACLTLRFFKARIAAEEAGLRALFGEEYDQYAARTRTWLPGVP